MSKENEMPNEVTKGEVMPKDLRSNATAAGDPPGGDPVTATKHQQIAARIIAALAAAKAEITPLESPTTAAIPFNRANGSIDLDFMVGVVGTVENTPSLQGLTVTLDLKEAHDTLDYIQAYVPLLNEIEAFRRALKFSIAARKADLGARSLRAYQAIRGLARDEKLALQPHASILKRALGRGPKRQRGQTPQTPQPQTPHPVPPLETGKEVPKP